MSDSLLSIDKVRKSYSGPDGQVRALREISLDVEAGEFVAVRGPSGCGKTTLLLTAGGLLVPDAGKVHVDGRDLYGLDAAARAGVRARTIGFVFQQFHLIPFLSVLDNVLTPSIELRQADSRQRALDLIEQLGLSHRKRHFPGQLSTGEKQRTALARALLNRPRLLLADEPTGNLDADNANAVVEQLRSFASNGGAVLLVTHDATAADGSDRTVLVKEEEDARKEL